MSGHFNITITTGTKTNPKIRHFTIFLALIKWCLAKWWWKYMDGLLALGYTFVTWLSLITGATHTQGSGNGGFMQFCPAWTSRGYLGWVCFQKLVSSTVHSFQLEITMSAQFTAHTVLSLRPECKIRIMLRIFFMQIFTWILRRVANVNIEITWIILFVSLYFSANFLKQSRGMHMIVPTGKCLGHSMHSEHSGHLLQEIWLIDECDHCPIFTMS